MSEAAALIFLTVLACLTIEPETTQFGFDLLLPASLASGIFGSRIPCLILRLLLNGRLEASHAALILRKVLAIHRIGDCTVSDRGRRFREGLLNFVEGQSGWHTPSVHLNHLGRYFVVRNRIRVNLMFHGNSSVWVLLLHFELDHIGLLLMAECRLRYCVWLLANELTIILLAVLSRCSSVDSTATALDTLLSLLAMGWRLAHLWVVRLYLFFHSHVIAVVAKTTHVMNLTWVMRVEGLLLVLGFVLMRLRCITLLSCLNILRRRAFLTEPFWHENLAICR